MQHDPGAASQELSKRLTVRITPALARALRIRVAELDVTVQDFVTSAVEIALKAELDLRPRR